MVLEDFDSKEKELLKRVRTERVERTGEYLLSSMVRSMREMGLTLEGHIMSYFNEKEGMVALKSIIS